MSWADAADDVLVVTMDRRPANALGRPIIDGLDAALDAAGTRTVVRASAVPGFFAAGADITHMRSLDTRAWPGAAGRFGLP